jgi:hypothetical protein
MADPTPERLQQRWLHSREEDSATETVYRPASYAFPRSRGRQGFELRPDRSLIEIGIAPTDGPNESPGTWVLEGRRLQFFDPSSRTPARELEIVSADEDRLVVKKTG